MDCTIKQQVARLAEQLFPASNYEVSFQMRSFSKEPLGFQGVHKLLIIEARERADASSVKIKRFFLKTTVPNCNDHQRNLFNREPRFFGHVLPRLLEICHSEPWAPKCYLARDNMLIFEDLKWQGFEVVREEFDETRLRSLFSCLARFHAASILLQESEGKPLDAIYPDQFFENMFSNDGQLTWKWLTTGIEVVEAIADRLGLDCKCIAEAYRLTLEAIKPIASELNVICHSDLWRNNVMFDEEGENCRLVDFQLSAYKCYVVDLLQALHLNSTKAARRRLEKSLIQCYLSKLNECLSLQGYQGKAIIVEQVLELVDKKRICGLVSAVQILPIALLNKQFSTELSRDSESLKNHMYGSRKSLVLRAMEVDADFRSRIEEVTIELIEYMHERCSCVNRADRRASPLSAQPGC